MNRPTRKPLRLLCGLLAGCMTGTLLAGVQPADVRADAPATVYAAAYLNAAADRTSLPAEVQINGQAQPVQWTLPDGAFSRYYSTVQVSGEAAGQTVQAQLEVVPENLYYFVHAGTGGDECGQGWNSPAVQSMAYESIAALEGVQLLNDTSDAPYTEESGWGHVITAENPARATIDGGDFTQSFVNDYKYGVGLRDKSSGTAPMLYRFTLPAGDYTLTAGFHEFYNNFSRVREMAASVVYTAPDGTEQTVDGGIVHLNNTDIHSSVEFTLEQETTVEYRLTYAGGEPGMYSWIAVAGGHIADEIAAAEQADASTVVIRGEDVAAAAENVNGLTFKGFGTLSSSSTSSLLMDYKAENPEVYAQLLQVLFGGEYPVMTHVKIEMGNDRNSSTGPDPCTMRTEDEPANVRRAPGFALAADARKVNPDIQISLLRWCMPAWVQEKWDTDRTGAGYDAMYKWYKETILAAYRTYGYMVTYVDPDANETTSPDTAWVKEFARRVQSDTVGFESAEEQQLYNSIRIVASDENTTLNIGPAMLSDSELFELVDAVGYHYNTDDTNGRGGAYTQLAEVYDKEVWNSEMQATFGSSANRPNNNTADPTTPGTGFGGKLSALEMGNAIIKSFVNSRRTHFIYQPAVDCSYEGFLYAFKDLVSMRDPWSGYVDYDPALHVLQHFSQFCEAGWENADNTAGIWRAIPQASDSGATGTNPANGRNGSRCYMTLAAPDATAFSTVVINDSEYTQQYYFRLEDMQLAPDAVLEVWETRAADDGMYNENYKKCVAEVSKNEAGLYAVTVQPWSMVTVTSLDKSESAEHLAPLPEQNIADRDILDTDSTGAVTDTADEWLYADDFEYTGKTVQQIGEGGVLTDETEDYIESRGGQQSATPRYTNDLNGAFEVYRLEDGNHVLRQQVTQPGNTWRQGDPAVTIGDFRWTNYTVSTRVLFEGEYAASNYAAVAARQQGGESELRGAAYAFVVWPNGSWQLQRYGSTVASGSMNADTFAPGANVWNTISLTVAGADITARANGEVITSYTDPAPQLSGRIDLATGYHNVQFDDLQVKTVDGYQPYYTRSLDNLQFDDLTAAKTPLLVYNELWSHACGTNMRHTQRTLSTSTGAGASLTLTFEGTGLDLYSAAGATNATLQVELDGKVLAAAMPAVSGADFEPACTLRGLPDGKHTVTFTVLSGTLAVDEVKQLGSGAQNQSAIDLSALKAAVESCGGMQEEEFSAAAWQTYRLCMEQAEAALADPAAYGLDAEGVAQLVTRLMAASSPDPVASIDQQLAFATFAGELPKLPETLQVTTVSGVQKEVPVVWNMPAALAFSSQYSVVEVSGTVAGWSKPVSARVEVVPKGIRWFVDTGVNGQATPPHSAVLALVPDLANKTADQALDANEWGYNAADITLRPGDDLTDKLDSGMYANGNGANCRTIRYQLPMEAGEYELAFGLTEWWGVTRSIKITASWTQDGQTKTETLADSVTISASQTRKLVTAALELEQNADVTLCLETADGANAPTLSFVAAARTDLVPEPTPQPTAEPTAKPTPEPTAAPTAEPTANPTPAPTAQPTQAPQPSPDATTPPVQPTQAPSQPDTGSTLPATGDSMPATLLAAGLFGFAAAGGWILSRRRHN